MLPVLPAMLQLVSTPVAPPPDWVGLQVRGARISETQVEVQDLFDLNYPDENNLIGRLGNRLHVSTKDAHIDPEVLVDGSVRAHVWVHDAWTLRFSIDYKLLGGQQASGASLQDQNFLGTGKTLMFNYDRSPIRSPGTIGYLVPRVLGSDWAMQAAYSVNSDGWSKAFNLQRPFLSLDTPWAATVKVATTVPREQVLTLDNGSLMGLVLSSLRVLGVFWNLRFDAVIDCELFARISSIFSFHSGARLRAGFHRHTQKGLYRGSFLNRPIPYSPYPGPAHPPR